MRVFCVVNILRKCTVPLLVRQRWWTPHRFSWPWHTASRSSLCSCSPHRPNRKQCFLHCTQMPGTLWKHTAPLWRNMKKTLDDPDSFHSTAWEQCAFILPPFLMIGIYLCEPGVHGKTISVCPPVLVCNFSVSGPWYWALALIENFQTEPWAPLPCEEQKYSSFQWGKYLNCFSTLLFNSDFFLGDLSYLSKV